MDYLVGLKVGGGIHAFNEGNSLFVRVKANSLEDAVEKAESAWGYDAISVGETPDKPSAEFGHSSRGTWRYSVNREETVEVRVTVGEEKL